MNNFLKFFLKIFQIIGKVFPIFNKGVDITFSGLSAGTISRNDIELVEGQLLSPPIFIEPLYACVNGIYLRGFIPDATIQVTVIKNTVIGPILEFEGKFPEPGGQFFKLPNKLESENEIRARQIFDGVESGWASTIVRDHMEDYPSGLPRTQLWEPIHVCGAQTVVDNVLVGSHVWIETEKSPDPYSLVGQTENSSNIADINVHPYKEEQNVRAWSQLCDDTSPPSKIVETEFYPGDPSAPIPPGGPLPAPNIGQPFEGERQVIIDGFIPGAQVTVKRIASNGTELWIHTWFSSSRHFIPTFEDPLQSQEELVAFQKLCDGTVSPNTNITVLPCSELPPPHIAPVQHGDERITVSLSVPDARIKIYRVNGNRADKIGDGGASIIQLKGSVRHGDQLIIGQILGSCRSNTLRVVDTHCVIERTDGNPTSLNLFPVGNTEFGDSSDHPRGTVFYPADQDGQDTTFNTRLAAIGPTPIILILHGNAPSDLPSHLGYNYFQIQMAQMGIICASIFLNDLNELGEEIGINSRADRIIATISHFKSLNDDSSNVIFGGHIDLSKIGLVGHSVGGTSTITATERPQVPDTKIQAVLTIAAADPEYRLFNRQFNTGIPNGYAYMAIEPAHAEDAAGNYGIAFYDRATPSPFKSLVYVRALNHNWFNR